MLLINRVDMKIVHVGFSPVTDGWTYQDNLLPKYHVRLGHQVWFITGQWVWGDSGKLKHFSESNYFNNDAVRMIRLATKRNISYTSKFRRFEKLYNTIHEIDPDILFIHGCQFLDIDVLVRYIRSNPNLTIYVDNHADFSNSARNWLSRNVLHKIIWKHYAQLILPYTRKYFGVLPARVDFLRDVYKIPNEKIELLVMGADDDLVYKALDPSVKTELRKKFNISQDDFLIMTGGKIDMAKYQTLLLMQAVQEIKNDKVKLIVFGSVVEELQDKVSALVDGKRVQYIGWIDADESLNYFAASDLVVFPGRHSVFWEQVVALGKPIIAKYWEGTTHIDIGGNCIFFDGNSVEEIRNNILNVYNNPSKLHLMRKVAEEKGMKTFSYARIAEKSIDFK
jgi:glycosyltransferase involved in cell wall biosynthesis